ncbi:major intrinsically disordered NOTCH2-binding receptor 1-like [Heterodontus francisci]|uniref:major intrinsically disordered NOTCH2-binding receptor 1-like n=1 Tax=Heterodontus francisci TaxID=7792 RepID=UPI00355BCAA7
MDLSVLPNNNHPDKFLQLDVKALATSPGLSQICFTDLSGAALSGQHWHNRVYSQSKNQKVSEMFNLQLYGDGPILIDKVLSKHITSLTLKSTIKRNPLYADIRTNNSWQQNKAHPSWTIQDYDRQSVQTNLADHLSKEDPNDLKFWLDDIYTPGYDSLLKKKESELKRSKCCKLVTLIVLVACTLITVITILIVVIGY